MIDKAINLVGVVTDNSPIEYIMKKCVNISNEGTCIINAPSVCVLNRILKEIYSWDPSDQPKIFFKNITSFSGMASAGINFQNNEVQKTIAKHLQECEKIVREK